MSFSTHRREIGTWLRKAPYHKSWCRGSTQYPLWLWYQCC